MPYAYPSPRTGTAQDLLRVVTRAYELRLRETGARLPEKSEAARRFVEPFFRAFGVLVGLAVERLPGDWFVALHDRLFAALSAPHSYPFLADAPAVVRARALAARLKEKTGQEPALIALLSHPPVLGDLAHMNLELVRHATLLLRAVRGAPCRPRMVAAIDPFALDTLAIWEEGLYAGYMGSCHLGIDRLALGRAHPGTALSPQAAWARMPHRMLRELAAGGAVGIVLAGGVPATGRVLYGVREWIRGARRQSPRRRDPAAVARALAADASFQRFKAAAEGVLHIPAGAWRVIDMWLMAAEAGLLSDEAPGQAARAALAALDVPEAARAGLRGELETLLRRETPYRRRLFRLLAGRVARRRPLVLIPLAHSTSPRGLTVREAWGWTAAGRGRVTAFKADAPDAAAETSAEAFADRFVEENFA